MFNVAASQLLLWMLVIQSVRFMIPVTKNLMFGIVCRFNKPLPVIDDDKVTLVHATLNQHRDITSNIQPYAEKIRIACDYLEPGQHNTVELLFSDMSSLNVSIEFDP